MTSVVHGCRDLAVVCIVCDRSCKICAIMHTLTLYKPMTSFAVMGSYKVVRILYLRLIT